MPNPHRNHSRLTSIGYAARGLALMFRSEINARIHAVATLIVVTGGFLLGIDRMEWLILILTIAAVLSLEAVNTAFEALCDVASPEHHPKVKQAKDVAAGAVLIAAIAAVFVAVLVFGRRLLALLASA